MTFLEAAIEILRHESDGLHFSEIAKRAVEKKLLSHVGRDPEAAMRSCLTSALRGSADGVLSRTKPGVYAIRPGAQLPEPPAPPPPPQSESTDDQVVTKPRNSRLIDESLDPDSSKDKPATKRRTAKKATRKKSTRSRAGTRRAASGDTTGDITPEVGKDGASGGAGSAPPTAAASDAAVSELSFEAPTGSGLDGVTDVAVVMANAMSRLADERPELREELEAMQSQGEEEKERPRTSRARSSSGGERHARARSEPVVSTRREPRERRPKDRDTVSEDDRAGRRRRRRRRRGRRVDWGEAQLTPAGDNQQQDILDRVASALDEIGSRALHVRQISEALAANDFLGGEISEIERAVTAAILSDVQTKGRSSRFSIRGDARYQLQSSRVPEPASKSEKALHAALRETERQTREQLLTWLQSLGARSLEALVRMYLNVEGYRLVGTLPLTRGLGKLIVDDPEAEEGEGRTLVLIASRKTTLEAQLWESEAERHSCGSSLVFSLGDPVDTSSSDARVLYGPDLARWMIQNTIGIERVRFEVPVLDAALIESIGGLDS